MATTGHARGDGRFGKTDGTGHHVGLWRDKDLENRVPWDRSVGIDTLRAIVSVRTDDETMIRLDEACFICTLVSYTEEGIRDLLDDDQIRSRRMESV